MAKSTKKSINLIRSAKIDSHLKSNHESFEIDSDPDLFVIRDNLRNNPHGKSMIYIYQPQLLLADPFISTKSHNHNTIMTETS